MDDGRLLHGKYEGHITSFVSRTSSLELKLSFARLGCGLDTGDFTFAFFFFFLVMNSIFRLINSNLCC